VKFRTASDRAVIAYLGDSIGADSHVRVVRLLHAIEHEKPPWLLNLHPAYCSLLVTFDALAVAPAEVEAALTRFEREAGAARDEEPRTIEIPVCYGDEYGPDLEAVAAAHGLTPRQVIEIHSGCSYRAYFLGFAPGFAYLGDVPESIATPRHATPRRSVPAGSVGIAGRQTGVYPFATPGGWQLIGRTPLAMFRADRAAMSLIALGDRVRFRAITHAEFLAAAAAAGASDATPARPAAPEPGRA
jgi:inhibitor of KinA